MIKEATINELKTLHIYSVNENYFLISKCSQLPFISLLSGHLSLSSPFVRNELIMGGKCFKLIVTACFVYLGVYMSP